MCTYRPPLKKSLFYKALSQKKLAKPDFFCSPRARAVRSLYNTKDKGRLEIFSAAFFVRACPENISLRTALILRLSTPRV